MSCTFLMTHLNSIGKVFLHFFHGWAGVGITPICKACDVRHVEVCATE